MTYGCPVDVTATTALPAEAEADTAVVGLFEGERVAHDVDGVLQGLIDAGEARPRARHLAVAHAGGRRWILVGLGAREGFDAERARVAAATALTRARELGTRVLCWEVPHKVGDEIGGALVEGTLLAAYRFEAFKGTPSEDAARGPVQLVLSAHHDVGAVARESAVVAAAVNAARDLQNAPANAMTPSALADAARGLAAEVDGLSVEVEGHAGIERRAMGAFAAVARGSDEEPALITLRYDGTDGDDVLGLVGKAVTFDSGGISIKGASKMHEMKFDMSGGAAVLAAAGAIARLALPVRLVAVIGATENMLSGRAMKPGDIVTAMTGTTIEVNNTDAEGRLVLADCLAHAAALGATRLVDVATLTGAVVTALGSTHAGLMASDDAWAAEVEAAARSTGELVWRLPLHPEYDELIKGRYADVVNAVENRKAGTITAAQFLARFTGDVPWAHLDIAGTAWDGGRAYAAKGGSGFGARLLVALARGLA
jgi:leucyl aminopeptidase